MQLRQAELEEEVRAEQMRLDRVAARLRLIEQEGRQPHYEVMIRPIPAMLVAGIRDTVDGGEDVRHLIEELRRSVAEWGITPGPLSPFAAVYYEWEYSSRVEVVVPLDKRRRTSGRVEIRELPGIDTAACLVHEGRSDQLTAAYQALTQWTSVHSYRRASHIREVFLQGFAGDRADESYVTEIQLPVEPLSFSTTDAMETQIMEPTILTKEAFAVVGLPFTGFISSSPYADGENNNEIGKFGTCSTPVMRKYATSPAQPAVSASLCPTTRSRGTLPACRSLAGGRCAGGYGGQAGPRAAIRRLPLHVEDDWRHLSLHYRGMAGQIGLRTRRSARLRDTTTNRPSQPTHRI
ncbi:MAG: GyrI-like domain-containing protein [Caldilineaceae bacterium]